MARSKLIINIIIYIIITAFLLYILIKEDNVSERIEKGRLLVTDKIIKKLDMVSEKSKIITKNFIWLIEFVGSTVILLIIIRTLYIGNFVVPTGSMIPTIMENDRLFANMAIFRFRQPKRGEIFLFKEPIQDKDLYTKRVMGLPGDKVYIKNGHLFINDEEITDRTYINAGKMGYDTWTIPKKGDTIEIIPKMDYISYLQSNNIDIKKIQDYLIEDMSQLEEILPDIEVKVNGKNTGMILDVLHDKATLDRLMKGETIIFVSKSDYFLALGDNTRNSFDSRMWGFVREERIKGKPLFRFWPLNRAGLLK